jgi:hypothetical protein
MSENWNFVFKNFRQFDGKKSDFCLRPSNEVDGWLMASGIGMTTFFSNFFHTSATMQYTTIESFEPFCQTFLSKNWNFVLKKFCQFDGKQD